MKLKTKTRLTAFSTLTMVVAFFVLKENGGVQLSYAWFPAAVLIGSWVILIKEQLDTSDAKSAEPSK